jgi:CheY-like chemotaxis protein
MENQSALNILLVEDDPAHAEIARRNLAACGKIHRLEHVSDGQEALDYLGGKGAYSDRQKYPRPSLVLLDLRLPKVDGLEVLRQIKTDPALSRIPVVVLTTSAAETDMVKAYTNHANSYLVKPIDFDKFLDLMNTLGRYWLECNHFPE